MFIKLPIYPTAGGTAIAILNSFATTLFIQEQAIVEVLRIAMLLALLILSFATKRTQLPPSPGATDDRCALASPP